MTSELTITVRGEFEERVPAELGVVRVTVQREASSRGRVADDLAAAADPIRQRLAALLDGPSLQAWTSSRAHVWTERPWGNEGTRLDPVHHASIGISATFTDVTALSDWVNELMLADGAQVDGIDWQLSIETASAVRDRVATAAVDDAVSRATSYAAALGFAEVLPTSVVDAGLRSPEAHAPRMLMATADSRGAADMRPDDVVVTAAVEATFTAR